MNTRPILATSGTRLRRRWPVPLGTLALFATAWAAPEGGTVTAGQAQLGRTGNLTTVAQQSQRAVIDWRSFSVGAAEAVNFRQPGATAVTLNRVTGNDPSAILGRITAPGSVYLVNPNGVLFGQGAQVDVGGLVASTANISNANFMAGKDRFDQPGKAGAKIDNQGTIRIANAGIAALVGRQVSNSGFIHATLGKVALAAGDAFVLDLAGDHLVNLILDRSQMEQVQDAQGRPLIARVDNTGNIQAPGGRVQLSAATVSSLLDNVINVQGDIRATALSTGNGLISLSGNETTQVTLGGVLQASGTGSAVRATGRDISVARTAQVGLGPGASLELSAGRDITVNAPIVLEDGSLTLAASQGSLSTAPGSVMQASSLTARARQGITLGGVLTSGNVDVRSTAGPVLTHGAVDAGGGVWMDAGTGTLTVGEAGIQSRGAGQGIQLSAGGDLQLNGDLVANAATVQLTSRAGGVTARVATPGANATAGDAFIDAGRDGNASRVIVNAHGNVALGDMRAWAAIDATSATGDVLLLTPIGGANTGYLDHAQGYQATLRPDVGTLRIAAPEGSVELNGLNLDGLQDPRGSGDGLNVQAARLILSNARMAVNKGAIVLAGGTSQPADGVYLGDSVFSRGWDAVGSDGQRGGSGAAADTKIGYAITVTGARLVLFDNTDQTASLTGMFRVTPTVGPPVYTDVLGHVVNPATGDRLAPAQRVHCEDCGAAGAVVRVVTVDANGQFLDGATTTPVTPLVGEPVRRNVASIEIANNAANYGRNTLASVTETAEQLRSALVPHNAGGATPAITVNVGQVAGSTMAGPTSTAAGAGRHTIAEAAAASARSLSTTASRSANDGGRPESTSGVLLKLLGFDAPVGAAVDTSTVVWPGSVSFASVATDAAQVTPNGLNGADPLFPDLGAPGAGVSPPVRSRFEVTLPSARVYISYQLGGVPQAAVSTAVSDLVVEMRQLPGELSGWAQVLGARLSPAQASGVQALRDGLPVGATDIRFGYGGPQAYAGIYTTVRGASSDLAIGTPGTASSIALSGSVLSTSREGVTSAQPLRVGADLAPRLSDVSSVTYEQVNGQTAVRRVADGFGGGASPTYSVSSVIVESSSNGRYPSTESGTRVVVFDGTLESQVGRATADSGGGPFVPGLAGTSGSRNSSTTTFTSVGAGPATVASVPLPPGAGPAPTPRDGGPFVAVTDVDARPEQDARRQAEQPVTSGRPAFADEDGTVEVGQRPAAQADFGRGAGVSGAAANVFKRRYRIATTSDDTVCAPGALAADNKAQKAAEAGSATGAQGSRAAAARPCRP